MCLHIGYHVVNQDAGVSRYMPRVSWAIDIETEFVKAIANGNASNRDSCEGCATLEIAYVNIVLEMIVSRPRQHKQHMTQRIVFS